MTAASRSLPGLLLFLAIACHGGTEGVPDTPGDGVPEPVRRDSAGTTILDYPADALAHAPHLGLDSMPLGMIGGAADTLLDLSGAPAPLVLSDGRIVVLLEHRIRITDVVAGTTESIGREGEGPGEFHGPDMLLGPGDTILVSDQGNSRISWVVPGHGVVRERRAAILGRVIWGAMRTAPGDTVLLAPTGSFFSGGETPGRVRVPLGRMTAGHDSIVTVLEVEDMEFVRTAPLRMGPDMTVSVAVERYSPQAWFAPWGDGVLASRADRWQLDRHAADGRLLLSLRMPAPRVPLTAAMRETDVAYAMARVRRPGMDPAFVEHLRHLPYPDSLPAFAGVFSTARGSLWLLDAHVRTDSTWGATLVDPAGRLLGRLAGTGPAPVAFGDDRVVFRDEDDDGIVTLRVLRIRFPG